MTTRMIWLVALTCATACGMEQPEELERTQQEIRGGWTTPASEKPGIGKVRLAAGGGRDCSGAVISPRYVITAASCNGQQDTLTPGINTFTLPQSPSSPHDILRIYIFGPTTSNPGQDLNRDVALLELTEPASVTPMPLSAVPPLAGETISYYGFGHNNLNCTAGAGVRTQGEFPFGIFSDFICPGDAGGPATLGPHGANGAIWGVNSRVSSNGDIWGDVARYKEDIMEVIRKWRIGHNLVDETNFRRLGVVFQDLPAASASACQTLCDNNASCASYNWELNPQRCKLMRDTGDWVPEPNVTSGLSTQNRYELDISRPGRDYNNIAPLSLNDCSLRCSSESRCAAFSWVASQNRCWLKEYAPGGVPAAGVHSGIKRKFEHYTDRWGNDLTSFDILSPTLPDPRVCQAACFNNWQCNYFTYKNPVYSGTNPPTLVSNARCFLKTGFPAPVVDTLEPGTKRFISGGSKTTP